MMTSADSHQLLLRFVREFYAYHAPQEMELLSGAFPAELVGNSIRLTNQLVHQAWDYVFDHPEDDRFNNFRNWVHRNNISRRDVQLMVTSVNRGSLDIYLEWLLVLTSSPVVIDVATNIVGGGAWDLIKYVLLSIRSWLPVAGRAHHQDPLRQEIAPTVAEIARLIEVSSTHESGIEVTYKHTRPDEEIDLR